MLSWVFLVVLLAATLAVGALWVSLIRTARSQSPYVPARSRAVEVMLKLTQPQAGMKMIDLGSGDGKIALAFATHGVEARGYEIQLMLVWWSNFRAWWQHWRHPQWPQARFFRQDLWGIDCSRADIVTVYLLPKYMGRIKEKLQREMKPGAQIVCYEFPLPELESSMVEGKVYVYEVKGNV